MSARIRPALIAAFLAGFPALAAEPGFGGQFNLAFPMGREADRLHMDGRPGLGLGLQVPIEFDSGHVLKPRLDYLAFNRNSQGSSYRQHSLVALAEYNHFFTGNVRDGAYLIAGLGFHSTDRKVSGNFANLGLPAAGRTSTGLAYDLGVGLALNRTVSLELRYLGMSLNEVRSQGQVVDPGFQGNNLVASVGFSF